MIQPKRFLRKTDPDGTQTIVLPAVDAVEDHIHGAHIECQRSFPFVTTVCGIAQDWDERLKNHVGWVDCPICFVLMKCPVCGGELQP